MRNLRPASVNLANATPNLVKVFTVLNHLFNMLGYNPRRLASTATCGGWRGSTTTPARVFSIQDANGDFRPLFLQASCASLAQIAQNLGTGRGSGAQPHADPLQRQSVPEQRGGHPRLRPTSRQARTQRRA